jgi:hypothetical protein
MTDNQVQVICCFCGHYVPFHNAIEITIKSEKELDEIQAVYSHSKCLDKALDKNVPRSFEIID